MSESLRFEGLQEINPVRPRLGLLSIAIRVIAVLNAIIIVSCLIVGKHDLLIPRETLLSLSIPYWVAPTSFALIAAVCFRIFLPRERAKGRVLVDLCYVAISIALLIALDLSMAGL